MSNGLLDGIRVVDLAGEPGAIAGRVLADLGADVVLVEPPEGHPLRALPDRWEAWSAGKRSMVVVHPDDPALTALLDQADVVIDTPGFPGSWTLDPGTAPDAVWVSVTPFGLTGPRARWRASDLGVLAASGNMYATGDADRPPVRCTEPSGYAHTGGEAAFAALSALWTGVGQRVDLSMAECVNVANMAAPARYEREGFRGRRAGAMIGPTQEIWPTRDGWVSFGLRGGKARIPSLETITRVVAEAGIDASALLAQDWSTWSPGQAPTDVLRAVEAPIAEYFGRHTMQELYDLACETNLMLAPANSPREILASAQLAARGFFSPLGRIAQFPASFVRITSCDGRATPAAPKTPAPDQAASRVAWNGGVDGDRRRTGLSEEAGVGGAPLQQRASRVRESGAPAWSGVNILEFGSGAAGPIATRYFVEHGATVLRVESRTRPDFLRVYALGPDNPHGLEGAGMYDGLNVGKRNVTFNLKHPDAVALVERLVLEWADAVAENFAPRAMKGFGLDYETLADRRPDLVMVSACLNGQTGPHKDYPGFGGQGAALSGYNWLTGWPDRAPLGPFGTITDSLAPRYVAAALAAGLHYRRRTGRGVYLDVSQVETGTWSLAPWLIAAQRSGALGARDGNRSPRAVPHGAFPCRDEPGPDDKVIADRWVAIACWTDEEWARLADVLGIVDDGLTSFEARRARVDEVEVLVGAWTADRTRLEVAEALQAVGIEAVPVQDFADVHADQQLASRGHFVELEHPFLGPGLYEHNGFRCSAAASGYDRAGPTLGQDNDWVLGGILGLGADEQARLRDAGAIE
ncbi:MAG TPA: CoA transferase [Acidimicrobiia bacterium]|nr:CoA transferase [Acidimicrobiia bacterium]